MSEGSHHEEQPTGFRSDNYRSTNDFHPSLPRRVIRPALLLCALLCVIATASTTNAAEPRRLTLDGRFKLAPVFVSDGRAIVYSVHDVPNRLTLLRREILEGTETRLLPETEQHLFDADASRDGRYLVFSRGSNGPQLPLIIKDTQKNIESPYNPTEFRSGVRCPRISPDNTRVIFGQSAPGGHQIVSVNMQAGDIKLLTQSAGINAHPDYSPDGKQIVFSSSRDGDLDIYVMQSDGTNVRRLTASPGLDMHPRWSPDGKCIAFTSRRDGNYEVYLMQADGTKPQNLTNHPERDDFPAWHPNGKQLVTVSERNGEFDLYVVDLPGEI